MNENIPQNSPNMQTTRKRRQPFTPDEDQKLRTVVNTFGENDWHVICKFMNGRTARQCRDRWREYLMPSLKLTEWTPEEDMILIEKINRIIIYKKPSPAPPREAEEGHIAWGYKSV